MLPSLSEADGFEWDKGNRDKIERRMPLDLAQAAFLGSPSIMPDAGHSEKERRYFLMNRVGRKHIFLAFTMRGKKIRIISARYMHDREVKKYAKTIG